MAERSRESKRCYYCNESGHFKRDCPKKKKNDQRSHSSEIVCYHCQETGHFKRDCPKRLQYEAATIISTPARKLESARKVNGDAVSNGTAVKCGSLINSTNKNYWSSRESADRKKGNVHSGQPSPLGQLNPSGQSSPLGQLNPSGQSSPLGQLNPSGQSSPLGQLNHSGQSGQLNPSGQSNPLGQLSPTEQLSPLRQLSLTEQPNTGQLSPSGQPNPTVQPSPLNPTAKEERSPLHPFGSSPLKQVNPADKGKTERPPLPPFVDTHCHLEYVFEKYRHEGTFSEFTKEWKYPRNFDACICSFCDPTAFSSFGKWRELLAEPGSRVWAAFGIHPHNAKYYDSALEDKVLKCLEHERCVAMGEIGLDYGERSPSDPKTQKSVLSRQLELGMALGKPFVLHCRDAEEDLLHILSDVVSKDWKIHLHCYTGTLDIANQFLEDYPNLFLGITGSVTYDNARNVRRVAQEVPLSRLLVETDAPYNTPRNLPRAGRCPFSHPTHAYYAAKEIANLKKLELSEVLSVLRENTRIMYGI